MRLDSQSGTRGMLFDAATGRPIRWCRWAEIPDDPEEEGEFEAFSREPTEAQRLGIPLESIVYRGRARLRFVPAAPRFGHTPTSQRDLSGSLDDARRRLVEPKLLIPGEECDEPGCHRLSEWRVSDEQEIEPQTDSEGVRHERAVTCRVRCYCSAHYKPPRFVNLRGVESEVPIEEARPQ